MSDGHPRRIVSLVPSVTEALFALGLGPRVVGATDYCVHPADAVEGLPRVGGTKDVDVEAVARLAPDLVLANREENTRRAVEQIEARGVADAEAQRAAAPPVRVFCPIWRDPWMAVSGDTYIHDLLALCGAENPWRDARRRVS